MGLVSRFWHGHSITWSTAAITLFSNVEAASDPLDSRDPRECPGESAVRDGRRWVGDERKLKLQRATSLLRQAPEEEVPRRVRTLSESYELSADLQDKQVEILERKYGGRYATHRAACTIQSAFRHYQMSRNFERLRSSISEQRLPRRMALVGARVHQLSLDSSDGSLPRHSTREHSRRRRCVDDRRPSPLLLDRTDVIDQSDGTSRELDDNAAITELESSFSRQVQTLAETIDSALLAGRGSGDGRASFGPRDVALQKMMQKFEGKRREEDEEEVEEEELEEEELEDEEEELDEDDLGHCPVLPPPSPYNDSVTLYIDDDEVTAALEEGGSRATGSDALLGAASYCDFVHCPSERDETSPLYQQAERRRPVSCPDCGEVAGSGALGMRATGSEIRASAHPQSRLVKRSGAMRGTPVRGDDPHTRINGGSGRATRSESEPSDGDNDSINSTSNSNDTINCSSESSRDSLRETALCRPSYHKETRNSWDSPAFTNDIIRKRLYRMGLNLFNKKPEKGLQFLMERGFIPDTPYGVAQFLLHRKGLSRQLIGDFLGNRQKQFNREVLDCVVEEMDFSNMELDEALRKFQAQIRVQGEAQKVERLVEAFSQRYCMCNAVLLRQFRNPDTIFILAFAIILLNTDLFSPNVKAERKMKLDDFIKNLRGVDDGVDIPRDMLVGIYDRIAKRELKTNEDHVSQVSKVEKSIVGKKPVLAFPHRRLVCYCRLFEVPDPLRAQKFGLHQREIFLFNDLLVVAKIFQKKKNSVTYTFRQSFALYGMQVHLFENQFYHNGIKITSVVPGAEFKVLIIFNAPNPTDRRKFVNDLRESIAEVQEMEKIRIESELEKQKGVVARMSMVQGMAGPTEVANGTVLRGSLDDSHTSSEGLKRGALSGSLRDLSDSGKRGRRSSAGSLDSNVEGSIGESSHQRKPGTNDEGRGEMHSSQPLPPSGSFLGSILNTMRGNKSVPHSRTSPLPSDCTLHHLVPPGLHPQFYGHTPPSPIAGPNAASACPGGRERDRGGGVNSISEAGPPVGQQQHHHHGAVHSPYALPIPCHHGHSGGHGKQTQTLPGSTTPQPKPKHGAGSISTDV
uniref:SEC7 domain-containing protein n=1 Tax=Eptatretus burgeri TaxID=7764 RepID=A0A8C4R5A5_EPTBU